MGWLKDYAVPSITVLGLVLFGILRLAYLFFYLPLRTTPEEVGYNYSRILSEELVGALGLVLLLAGVLFGFAMALQVLLKHRSRGGSAPRSRRKRWAVLGHSPFGTFAKSFLAAATVVVVALPIIGWWQGTLAEHGQTVRNVYFIGVPRLPVLAVQAVPARVEWIDPTANSQIDLHAAQCLMYLGESNGTAIFYDVPSRSSVRLPTSDVTIVLRFSFRVDASCTEAP